jgi:hypothetical protein
VPARSRNCDCQRQTTTESFLDRLEDLLGSTPAPLRSTAERARFLDAYVDVLVEHRPVAGLLIGSPLDSRLGRSAPGTAGGRNGSPGSDRPTPTPMSTVGRRRAQAASDAVQALVAGPDADLAEQVRTAVALAGLIGAVASCPGGRVDAVRATAVACSIAALGASCPAHGRC